MITTTSNDFSHECVLRYGDVLPTRLISLLQLSITIAKRAEKQQSNEYARKASTKVNGKNNIKCNFSEMSSNEERAHKYTTNKQIEEKFFYIHFVNFNLFFHTRNVCSCSTPSEKDNFRIGCRHLIGCTELLRVIVWVTWKEEYCMTLSESWYFISTFLVWKMHST